MMGNGVDSCKPTTGPTRNHIRSTAHCFLPTHTSSKPTLSTVQYELLYVFCAIVCCILPSPTLQMMGRNLENQPLHYIEGVCKIVWEVQAGCGNTSREMKYSGFSCIFSSVWVSVWNSLNMWDGAKKTPQMLVLNFGMLLAIALQVQFGLFSHCSALLQVERLYYIFRIQQIRTAHCKGNLVVWCGDGGGANCWIME